MKADALIRFMLLGNRSWEEFAILLARISLGAFFAISGGNKLFVAAHTREMYETIAGAGIPFPHVMAYLVSSVEFICGSLLIIGLLSSLCCIALIFDMIAIDGNAVVAAERADPRLGPAVATPGRLAGAIDEPRDLLVGHQARRHCQLKQRWYAPAVGGAVVRCGEVLGTP